ncbi:uncharacterized protein PgNI_02603 [Pyricularia grisea]|uniref:PKS/mFAS DH domain-containing protein n=1 Tax=Pyricularia grisea TaxID=148305 RepID=A0A6P8BHV2_PYRGI|nr:uncharacterized protein PgNI_02603 [Pyricularia grisea]TLD16305.1 hypothetical protein PgNI_02603 [Pyricularia grisea]
MTMQGKWAVGTIKRPKHFVALEDTERSVLEFADAVVADNFVQVFGLAINTSEHVFPGSAFIVLLFDSFTLSSACRLLNRDGMWNVTSHYNAEENSKTITGDIYVTDENGEVVASARGVRFSSVQLDNLDRVLGLTAASGQDKSPVRTAAEALPHPWQNQKFNLKVLSWAARIVCGTLSQDLPAPLQETWRPI